MVFELEEIELAGIQKVLGAVPTHQEGDATYSYIAICYRVPGDNVTIYFESGEMMKDKICLITGANSGIGFELAKGMAEIDYITMIGGNGMSSNIDNLKVIQVASPRQWIRLVVVYLFIPLVLLVCGGDFGWWQAWGYSLLLVAASLGGRIWAERRHPGLLAERQNMEKVQSAKAWDKVLAPLMALSVSFPLVIVAGLDHRFGWSPVFPLWLTVLGLLLIALGYAFGTWALIENRFFSGVVRIQADRGHVVCDSGPYRIVRHPGYAGSMLALPGLVLALSSMWTLIPAAVALIIAVIRTALEDQTLQGELPGYRDYARRVRYRLIPGIY